MKLPAEQLPGRELAPVYLISGDEPLLVAEAADRVRAGAREAGFTEREVMFADKRFNWGELLQASHSMSLFAERRVLDVRIEALPSAADAGVIKEYCDSPPPDTLLLLTAPRVDLGRGWGKSVDSAGVVVQIWPPRANEMPKWLQRRCRDAGVELDPEAFSLLLARVEGNLLAATQEVARLQLLGDGSRWDRERLLAATADSSRFDAFAWVEALFNGDLARALHILDTLKAEGAAPLMILGALNSQLRRMAGFGGGAGNLDSRLKREGFFGERARAAKALLTALPAARLAAIQAELIDVDLRVKGAPGDPWDKLADIAMQLCQRGPRQAAR